MEAIIGIIFLAIIIASIKYILALIAIIIGVIILLLFSALESGLFIGITLIIILPLIWILKIDIEDTLKPLIALFMVIMFIIFIGHNFHYVSTSTNEASLNLNRYLSLKYIGINIDMNTITDYFEQKTIKSNADSFLEEFNPIEKEKINKIKIIISKIDNRIEKLKELKVDTSSSNSQYITKRIKKHEKLKRQLEERYKKIYLNFETAYVMNESKKIEGENNSNQLSQELLDYIDKTLIEAETVRKTLVDESLKEKEKI